VRGDSVQRVTHGDGQPVGVDAIVEDLRVVRIGEDRLAEGPADLAGVDIDGGDDLDVAGGVSLELRVQQTDSGGRVCVGGIALVVNGLDEG